MNKAALRTAFRDTLPVMTGYIFLGIGFGIYLNENGYGLLWSLAMSIFIYAGSMQYVAISLMTGSFLPRLRMWHRRRTTLLQRTA